MATASQSCYTTKPRPDDPYRYQTGFGNRFESEAIPETLPYAQNTPQRCRYDLYSEVNCFISASPGVLTDSYFLAIEWHLLHPTPTSPTARLAISNITGYCPPTSGKGSVEARCCFKFLNCKSKSAFCTERTCLGSVPLARPLQASRLRTGHQDHCWSWRSYHQRRLGNTCFYGEYLNGQEGILHQ